MVATSLNSFNSRSTLTVGRQPYQIFRLEMLERAGVGGVGRLPFSIRTLLENMRRGEHGHSVQEDAIESLARRWRMITTRASCHMCCANC